MGLSREVDAKIDRAKGAVEQEAGKATDDKSLEMKGIKDELKGHTKEAVEDVRKAVRR